MSSLDQSLRPYRAEGGTVEPVEPQAELRPRTGRLDHLVRRVADRRAHELAPPARQPFERADNYLAELMLDVGAELRLIARILREIRDVESGDLISKPVTLRLSATTPFYTFVVDAPEAFHSLKIDNPSGAVVDVRFDGSQVTAGNSDERVPAHMGRMLTRPYSECSVGFDPAVVPAGVTPVYVTFYSRALPPASWAFV